jgi:hypothetical protein
VATEREVYDALTGKGFSMAQAAGIMGNIQNESGYNQEAVGDGGTSFGLVQWHVPGYPFAPGLVTGNLDADLSRQMGYIVQASHGVDMRGSAEAVAGAWASQFERCVGCQPGGAQYASRVANAGRIFTQAQTGKWPGGPGQPGGPGPGPGPGGTGSPPGVSSPGLLQELGNVWGIPFNFWTSAAAPVTGIVTATEDVAQALAGISNVFAEIQHLIGAIAWFFVPSHIVRVISFILGVPLVGFGIFNLTRTGQPYSIKAPVVGDVPASGGNLAPAIGIAEVTAGSILLFIAFHNLPATVVDLPSLLTFVQESVAQPGGSNGGGGTA